MLWYILGGISLLSMGSLFLNSLLALFGLSGISVVGGGLGLASLLSFFGLVALA